MEPTPTFDLTAAVVARPHKWLLVFKLARTLGWLWLCAALAWQGGWVAMIGCGVAAVVGLLPRGSQARDAWPRRTPRPRRNG